MASSRGIRSGGRRIGGYNPNSAKNDAPIRRILRVLRHADGAFTTALVELDCGHTAQSNGTRQARCLACKARQGTFDFTV
jgi:hypothetical protein